MTGPDTRRGGAPVQRLPLSRRRALSRRVDALAAGNAALRRELLARFIRANVDDLAAIETVAMAQDWQALRAHVHRLQGSSGLLGCTALAALGGRLDAALAAGDAGAVRAMLPCYAAMVAALTDALRELRRQNGGA